MNDPHYRGADYDPYLWRPHVPSPYVTHQDIAPMHTRIGALEKGQESIISTYSHLRGEMIHSFDEIKKLIRDQAPPQQQGVNLSFREVVIFAGALVLVGAFLSRLPGVETMLGSG